MKSIYDTINIFEVSKRCETIIITDSSIISQHPCWFMGLKGEHAANDWEFSIKLYNGVNTDAQLYFEVKRYNKDSLLYSIIPIYFNKGLYIENDDNMGTMLIQIIRDI